MFAMVTVHSARCALRAPSRPGTALLVLAVLTCPGGAARAHGDARAAPGARGLAAFGDTVGPTPGAPAGSPAGTSPKAPADAPGSRDASTPAPPHAAGTWSEPVAWPVLAVHAALLPTGEVLAWDATPDDFDDDPHTSDNRTTRVTLWDPATDAHLAVWNDGGGDLFCAGSAHLWDGRVLFAGGDSGRSGRNGPLANSNVFDPWTRTWSETDTLNAPRWYSSVAALASGEMLTFGGTYSPRPLGEVFELNERWRPLPLTVPFTVSGDYAWLQSTSDGDVAYLGPDAALGAVSTDGDGAWSSLGTRDDDGYRSYGSYALFDVDRALVSGGGDSLASATVVDLATGTSEPTAPMRRGRRQHDLTILADGTVLASGGNASGARFVDLEAGTRTAEVWDPATGRWSDVAPLPTERQYHSTALLLPDGRVLSAGGGYCSTCGTVGYHAQSAELFTPPHLYGPDGELAERPLVTAVPERVDWDEPFEIGVSDADAVRRVHLIKLGSVTHSQNQDQRLVPLSFRSTGDGLVVEAPADRRVAPPGHYLLFVVDGRGVPSVAPIVRVGQPLLGPGDVVVDAARARGPERYEVLGDGSHVLRVRLQGDARALRLAASARARGGPAEPVPLACAAADGPTGGLLCAAHSPGAARWMIDVDGPEGVPYSLVADAVPGTPADAAPGRWGARGAPGAPGAPAAPANPRAVALGADAIELTWDAPTGGDVAGHEIHRDGRLVRFVPGSPAAAARDLAASGHEPRLRARRGRRIRESLRAERGGRRGHARPRGSGPRRALPPRDPDRARRGARDRVLGGLGRALLGAVARRRPDRRVRGAPRRPAGRDARRDELVRRRDAAGRRPRVRRDGDRRRRQPLGGAGHDGAGAGARGGPAGRGGARAARRAVADRGRRGGRGRCDASRGRARGRAGRPRGERRRWRWRRRAVAVGRAGGRRPGTGGPARPRRGGSGAVENAIPRRAAAPSRTMRGVGRPARRASAPRVRPNPPGGHCRAQHRLDHRSDRHRRRGAEPRGHRVSRERAPVRPRLVRAPVAARLVAARLVAARLVAARLVAACLVASAGTVAAAPPQVPWADPIGASPPLGTAPGAPSVPYAEPIGSSRLNPAPPPVTRRPVRPAPRQLPRRCYRVLEAGRIVTRCAVVR